MTQEDLLSMFMHAVGILLHDWKHMYFPVPSKCTLVVDDCSRDKAQDLLSSLGVHVVASHRFLRGFIGSKDEVL